MVVCNILHRKVKFYKAVVMGKNREMAERIFNTILDKKNWSALGNSLSEISKKMNTDCRIVKEWINLIFYIQNKPKLDELIKVVETSHVTYIIPKEKLLGSEGEDEKCEE